MLKNRKGTIGAAMTWVVATIIILLFIFIFVYASYAISKERQIKNFSPVLNSEKSYDAGSEQILLALLQTKIGDKSLKDLIISGDYDKIENYRPILEKLSNEKDGYWNLYIYENNDVKKKIETKTLVAGILEKKNAMVYLSSNKQVRLLLN